VLIALAAAALAGCGTAPPGEPGPGDFASGVTLDVPAADPFVRVALPGEVFTGTAWADLRDLRVFNAAGEPVPFARIAPSPTKAAAQRISLRSFRLAAANPGRLPSIELDAGARGVELRVSPGAGGERGAEYLLATSEADQDTPLERLHLAWADAKQNWQQKVTVSVSRDLQSWNTVAFRRPIMDLRTEDGERLRHAEIVLDAGSLGGRYWRLHFDPGFAPALVGVEGESIPEEIPSPGVPIPARVEPQPDGSLVVHLDRAHPVARLRITPADANSVLPVRIEGRADDREQWVPVATAVAYRLNAEAGEQVSEPVRLSGGSLASFRLRAAGTSWGSSPPAVSPERDGVVLVVNARGAGPFLLAWGSRAASDAATDVSMLVPGGREAVAHLADARFGPRQELGGPSRLTALAPGERRARWQTALVWVALVGGALALAFLALRLFRAAK
jgi:hypothetical protein